MEKSDCNNRIIDFIHYFEAIPVIILLIFIIFFIFLVSPIYFIISIGILCMIFFGYPDFVHKKTIGLIKKYPERGSDKPHHAIIIAHKTDNIDGKPNRLDYLSGADILIEKFQNPSQPVNYKIYEVNIKEQVIPVILDENVTHLWIFGHGQRNKLRLKGENLCYFEVRRASQKVFIGQYHCNSIFGKSLADYNFPKNQDVTHWVRMDPFIRFSVLKKLKELELNNLL